MTGPWDISFPPKWGAPDKVQLGQLESWTANADEGVKYFSGTATYTKTVQARAILVRRGDRGSGWIWEPWVTLPKSR